MAAWMAITVGVLYGCAFYMMLRRSMTKMVIGLILLSNAANLLIFVSAGLTRAAPALIPGNLYAPEGAAADPLAQALILTAIVIGFGVLAFAVVLIHRAHSVLNADDLDMLKDEVE